MAKRLAITKEKHEIILIRQTVRREIRFCNECEKKVLWLSAKAAAEVSGNSELNIFRKIESGTVHYKETAKGILSVCFESLPKNRNCRGEN